MRASCMRPLLNTLVAYTMCLDVAPAQQTSAHALIKPRSMFGCLQTRHVNVWVQSKPNRTIYACIYGDTAHRPYRVSDELCFHS